MGEYSLLVKEIRQRLYCPPNAVPDSGIDLKRRRTQAPPLAVVEPIVIKPLLVQPELPLALPPLPEPKRKISMSEIMKVVCQVYRLTMDDMKSKLRTGPIVAARQMYIWVACRHTLQSVSAISRSINRDHTTSLHARKKIQKLVDCGDNKTIDIIKLIEIRLGLND